MKKYIKSSNYSTSQEYFEATTEEALKHIVEAEKLFNEMKQQSGGTLYTACADAYEACQAVADAGHEIYRFFNPENY